MSNTIVRCRALLVLVLTLGLTSVFLISGISTASAAPAPVQPLTPEMMSADRLPTVQVDGVVWSQAVVGNTVYAGGRFANARPAGAAAGTNQTPRGNLLAYDITTGNLITSFAPTLNGQVLSVAASPDGTRIYVVGDFTTANGQARRRVAAYSTATGALLTAFNPVGVNSQARAVIATNDTVYVGGGFQGVGNGQLRGNLAAFRASDGALLNWNPGADYTVWALGVSADGLAVFAGGSFQNVGGQPAYGLAKIDPVSGALDGSWRPEVRNAGPDAGISSLRVQGNFVYGTTWHFGPGGNLEGTFKVPTTGAGNAEWVTDCHGDVYSSYMTGGVVYVAGHAHYCGNMGGGFPQYSQWRFSHAQAWTDAAGGDILNEVHGYPNWHGVKQAPALVNWQPDMAIGSVTGQYQAGWNVTGNNDYVVFGGEFPRVNGVAQQGLVRFAKRSIAPKAEGPKVAATPYAPTLVATSPTSVRVSWPAAFDRDDYSLTYRAVRNGAFGTPRKTLQANSTWWNTPTLGFVDTGLTPGTAYSYQVVVNDSNNNTVYSGSTSITMPASVPAATAYTNTVRANGARIYWPLNETSGLTVTDRAAGGADSTNVGVTDGRADNGVTWGQPGAITGDSAASLGDNDWSRVFAGNCATTAGCNFGTETAPDTFTTQLWIKTATTNGGRLLGFGDLQNGGSGHRDRHLYMDNAGRLVFGVKAQDGSARTVSSGKTYNDNAWHMVTATMSPEGMALYVDGVRVARRTDTTQGEAYLGYWRLGGDNLDGWASRPNSFNFVGSVDEVAIYPTALDQAKIIAQYEASGRTSVIPPAPADPLGAAVYADEPDLYWRFDESSGTKAADSGKSLNDGTYRNGVTLGSAGIVSGTTAATFNGANQFVASDAQVSNPTVFTEEAWFKTTSNRGGKIIGFGNSNTASSNNYDRHAYLQDDGKVVFGTYTGQLNTITTAGSFNDGDWHHMVASQGPDGMKLYVDGVLNGTNPQTQAQAYDGYWKVGGDNTWSSSSAYLEGTIDEAAVYSYVLSPERVTAHFVAGGGKLNQQPVAAFTSAVDQRQATFDGSGSADPDGTVASHAWDFGDETTGTGATPTHVYAKGGTYTVTLTVTDNKGAAASSSKDITVTAPAAPADNYGAAVVADAPALYWRLNETSGTTAVDSSGALGDGTFFGGYSLGQPGALPITNKAVGFNGNDGFVSSNQSFTNPTTYSQESWFKTTTTRGGKIMGFGNNRTGASGGYDRHVYMKDDGHLVFGTWTGQENTITSPASYNNGEWHHVVATQSGDGMRLYVDGQLTGTNPQTQAQDYTGYFKVGGDVTWGGASSWFLDGTIDESAFYLQALSAGRVQAHYEAAAPAPNQKPTARFDATDTALTVSVDAGASTDPDGEVTAYSWDFGDGWTTDGKTASHTYATAGTKTITLTVTDDDGATDTVSHDVTVKAANVLPTAAFSAQVDDLDLAVDAADSEDTDGDIESYVWDFGDGQGGTGDTAEHTYDEAGEYDVTLTVTDDRDGTSTLTKKVTATEPPNQDPIAAFTSTTNALLASFDAGGSTDPDGTVASYDWKFGNEGVGTGKTASFTFPAAGTYQVELTVTDDDGGTNKVTQPVTVSPANQSPGAAFEATVSNLNVTVDAGASDDPDGDIDSYSWDFGDGTTKTGETAQHTYATAGLKTITLTVTDDDDAATSVTKSVTVTEPPNEEPTAAFTHQATNLAVAFDGRGSSDSDGTIVAYSWNFGDAGIGTGAQTSHTYVAAGTYTVVLTVTDDDGVTHTTSEEVTVTAPTTLASDGFSRTVSNGWGSAEVGGPWTISSTSSNFGVVNGVGTMRMATSSGPSAYLNGVTGGNVDLTSTYSYDKPGSGGGVYTSLVGRRIGTSDYRVKIRVTATATTVYLVRTVGGTETTLATQDIAGPLTAGTALNVRFQIEGTGAATTTLRAKAWITGAEPTAWTATATDTTAALQNPGSVGIYSYLSGSATNGPITLRVDNFTVRPIG